ncbi:MAG TPA: triose-phosphate isomerase family protein [Cellulomonas sp.]
MTSRPAARPLAAVSLKAYLGHAETARWLAAVRPVAAARPSVEVAVLPLLTSVPAAIEVLGDVCSVGAQAVSTADPGPATGEVPAAVLAELGVRYGEIGHAERRAAGEDDALFAAQARTAVSVGVEPLICVGEPTRTDPAGAATWCTGQLDAVLAGVTPTAPVVVAYEPVWAIGAADPAPAAHVTEVADRLRRWAEARSGGGTGAGAGTVRLLYGGTAGPGTFAALTPHVDGLFLGRRAHDPAALADVLDEMVRTVRTGEDHP